MALKHIAPAADVYVVKRPAFTLVSVGTNEGDLFQIDGLLEQVWLEIAKGPTTTEQVVEVILSQFEVEDLSEAETRTALEEFIEQLLSLDLIKCHNVTHHE